MKEGKSHPDGCRGIYIHGEDGELIPCWLEISSGDVKAQDGSDLPGKKSKPRRKKPSMEEK